jgi:hypothetical protein
MEQLGGRREMPSSASWVGIEARWRKECESQRWAILSRPAEAMRVPSSEKEREGTAEKWERREARQELERRSQARISPSSEEEKRRAREGSGWNRTQRTTEEWPRKE